MICHYCCRGYTADGFDVRPCPECGGSGFVHCCEGERPDQCPEQSQGAAPERLPSVRWIPPATRCLRISPYYSGPSTRASEV